MNTVGKTLVILNLLFALITGGFLIIDFATRTNWRKGFDDLKRELEVSQKNTETLQATNGRLMAEVKSLDAQLLDQLKKYEKLEKDTKDLVKKAKDDALTADGNRDKAILSSGQMTLELERLRNENKELLALLKKRQEMIVALEQEKNKYLAEAQAAINERDAALERNMNLLARLREVEVARAKAQVAAGPASTTTSTSASPVRDRNQANPPPFYVRGIIEAVDGTDRSLVKISLGSDAGIQVDHTLEVYRLYPRAEYLGMVRIVETDKHASVGRLIRLDSTLPMPVVRKGDEVASKIMPR